MVKTRARGTSNQSSPFSVTTAEGVVDPVDQIIQDAVARQSAGGVRSRGAPVSSSDVYSYSTAEDVADPIDQMFQDAVSLEEARQERLDRSLADIQERYDLRERDIEARNRRIEDAGIQAFYERPTGPMTRADGYDTSKVQLPEGAPRADEREAQTEGFVDAYVRRRQAGAPKFSTYDPKVYGLDPKFAKQREEVASNLEAKRLELEQMRDTD